MSLRDQLTSDSDVFLDTSEFADTLEVDGEEVSCILDDKRAPGTGDGVVEWDATLIVATDAIETPSVRQRMTIDGRSATVAGTEENGGLLHIRLRWFES